MKQLYRLLMMVLLTSVALQAVQRPTAAATAFKGYELYSWQEADGSWVFRLLLGTNALKTADQVFRLDGLLHGVDELKVKMAELPEGESIFWISRISPAKSSAGGAPKLSYPPPEVVEELQQFARERELRLSVFRP